MNWGKSLVLVLLAGMTILSSTGCESSWSDNDIEEIAPPEEWTDETLDNDSEEIARPEGWTDETHGNDTEPDYEVVFPQDEVNEMSITIAPEDWEAMQANMTVLFGEPGQEGGAGRFPGRGGNMPDRPFADGDLQRPDGMIPGGGGAPGGGMGNMNSENPMWVTATIEFEGLIWTNVGVRYKGNSSLISGWRSGTLKLPFKLDFDEFEDDYPEIDDQRFYGFKQLSLSNAFSDPTYMRDAISADILEEAGLAAAETAFYEIYLDYGEGPVYLGLYVMIEVIDDTVIDRVFGDDSGNIYEGDGSGCSLAEGTFDSIESGFEKENNESDEDWSDIETLYNILHSKERLTDPETWRAELESVFDVDAFLEWLAISAIIQHWDSYGQMSHNFYLYHDPDSDRLIWISWDHNQVLSNGGMGNRDGAGGMGGDTSLGKEEVNQNWPLIRYLLDDPVYNDLYNGYLEETIDGPFDPEALENQCRELAELISPYVDEGSGSGFESSVQSLIDRIYERYEITKNYVEAMD